MKKIFTMLAVVALGLATPAIASAQSNFDSALVAHYHMTDTVDNSGNGYNLYNNGATLTTDRFGNMEEAYYFDGYATMVCNLSTVGFKGMTISAWIKTEANAVQATIAQVSGNVCYVSRFTNSRFLAGMDGTTANNSSAEESSAAVGDNKWHFVCATNDGSTTRIYVDGKLENTYSETLYTQNGKLVIGGQINGQWYFTGSMDDLSIYTRALSSTDVKTLYDKQKVQGTDASVAKSEATDDMISVYPNPSNGRFTVKSSQQHEGDRLEIVDISGRVVYTAQLGSAATSGSTLNIDLSIQPAGIYVMNLSGESGSTFQKLVIK